MLISVVLPIISLYRLPHGQYAYSGHVIKLPPDVASFVNSLSRLPSELDIIVVQKEGAANTHDDFRVMHFSDCLLTTGTTSMFASTLMPSLCFQMIGT